MQVEQAAPAPPRLRLVRPDEVPPAVARARIERSSRRVLVMLTVSVAVLTIGGLIMVLSASSVQAFAQYGSSFYFFEHQAIFAVIGVGAAVVAARLPYTFWQRAWPALVGASVLLLALVLQPSAGQTVGGAARWIPIGPFSLQPSELAKFAVVAATATILARNYRFVDEPLRLVTPILLIVGLVLGLIMLQPDFGTAMIIVLTVFLMLFAVGVRARVLLTTFVLAGGAGMMLIMSSGYRRARFLSFLHPWADPRNSGYQVVQSMMALGSGHWVGVGLGASRQKWLFVPNAHTDFIFSIIGEELGLLGALAVLALFGLFAYAGIRIAMRAPDAYGRLLAVGITGWLGLQALINMGAVVSVLPITGVPLPFVSYGGSSLIVSLAAVGVLRSIGKASLAAAASPSRRGRRASRRPDAAKASNGRS